MAGNTVLVSACIALGNMLEPLLGTWLLTRDSRFDPLLRRYRDFLRLLFLAGIASSGVSALNGVITLFTAGLLTQQMLPHSLLSWWMPEVLDVLVRGVEAENPSALCSIMLLDDEGKRLVVGVAPSLPDAYSAAMDGIFIGDNPCACSAAAHWGKRIVVEDI